MKHLYIIGNGFDIFSGLRTRYVDFRHWLQYTYPFIYENMCAAYEMDGEWWHDFEFQLGKLDVQRYVNKFAPPDKPIDEIKKEIAERRAFEEKYNLPPNLHHSSPCANRLRGLLDVIQYSFERWIEYTTSAITNPKYTYLERNDSYFITFNYTDVLQMLYGIKDEQILYIHGRASRHDHLVFGHNTHHFGGMMGYDEEQSSFELDKYIKNPYEHIIKHDELPVIICDTEYVHVYGFSISEIDEDYLDWIEMNTPQTSKWEFSWYSEEDKKRIERFILNHWSLKDRHSLMQLQEITREEANAVQ
jgi:hypothetical protein